MDVGVKDLANLDDRLRYMLSLQRWSFSLRDYSSVHITVILKLKIVVKLWNKRVKVVAVDCELVCSQAKVTKSKS